jgi:acyl carrier protein phosphodiesterase
MNFLAHLYLSADGPEARAGNLIADFVKGPRVAALPPGVQRGVRQHRLVDGFTDRHPVVQRGIGRIGAEWGWFSGIILDVYFDHLLARDWARWSAEPLRTFADRVYAEMQAFADLPDPDHRGLIPALVRDDRLASYATLDGIRDTLVRVSGRIAERMPTRARPLADSVPLLMAVDADLEADFRAFFPELRAFAATA